MIPTYWRLYRGHFTSIFTQFTPLPIGCFEQGADAAHGDGKASRAEHCRTERVPDAHAGEKISAVGIQSWIELTMVYNSIYILYCIMYYIYIYHIIYIDHSLSNERTKEGTDQHTKRH